MRAAAKSSKPGTRAGVGILKPPKAGEIEIFGEAQHEADDRLDITMVVIVDPEDAALGRVLTGECKARDLRVVCVRIRSAQVMKQRERAGGLVGSANVDQA